VTVPPLRMKAERSLAGRLQKRSAGMLFALAVFADARCSPAPEPAFSFAAMNSLPSSEVTNSLTQSERLIVCSTPSRLTRATAVRTSPSPSTSRMPFSRMSALAAPKREGLTLALESSAVRPASSKRRATAAFSSARLLARAASFSARSLVRVFKSSSFSPRSFLVLSSSALRVSSSFMEVSSSSGLVPEKASTLRSSFLMRAQSRAARGSIFSMRGRMLSLCKGPSLPSSNLRWLMMSLRLVMPLVVIVGGSIRPVGHAHGLLVIFGSALERQCAVPA